MINILRQNSILLLIFSLVVGCHYSPSNHICVKIAKASNNVDCYQIPTEYNGIRNEADCMRINNDLVDIFWYYDINCTELCNDVEENGNLCEIYY